MPIPGSKNPVRVADNVAAADVVLTVDDCARIDALSRDVRGKRIRNN